jgi:hypothetical protein
MPPAVKHYLINIRYALTVADKDHLVWMFILSLLSIPKLNPNARKKAMILLNITSEDVFTLYKPAIDKFVADSDRIKELVIFADFDTSVPGSLYS